DLLRRLDRREEAVAEYGEAYALTGNDAERRFLARRMEDLPRSSAPSRGMGNREQGMAGRGNGEGGSP
ncbi:MAG: hypothetical protein ACREOJ_01270, partial [Gemmatimonadaceae bacterium]